jgi:hypothetical protein
MKRICQEDALDHDTVIEELRYGFQQRCGVDFLNPQSDGWTVTAQEAEELFDLTSITMQQRDRMGVLFAAFADTGCELREKANDFYHIKAHGFLSQDDIVQIVRSRVQHYVQRENQAIEFRKQCKEAEYAGRH